MKSKTGKQIDPKRFVKAVMSGASIQNAMLIAGYSESCARAGRARLSPECKKAWAAALDAQVVQGKKTAQLGSAIEPQFQENFVRGKLYENAIEGKDRAVQSLKMLGQDKRVNMFAPESNGEMVIIAIPPNLPPMPPVATIIDAAPNLPPIPGTNRKLLEAEDPERVCRHCGASVFDMTHKTNGCTAAKELSGND